MSYCHQRRYNLRYTEFDFKDELKLSAILGLTQEAATSSADELGFGYEHLKPKNLGFFIVNTYCKLERPVLLGESVTVETWPLPPRRVIFERDYQIKDEKGVVVASLASRWCLVDMQSFALQTPDKLGESHEKCPYNATQVVSPSSWKIAKLHGEGEEVYRMRVGSSQCDHYLHANNTRYADFFIDCFTMDELASKRVRSFQISYGRQAKEGDELIFVRRDFDEGICILEALRENEVLAQFQIQFEGEKS